MTYSTNNWPSGSNSKREGEGKRVRGKEGESLSSERAYQGHAERERESKTLA